jgi:hypothetical protein
MIYINKVIKLSLFKPAKYIKPTGFSTAILCKRNKESISYVKKPSPNQYELRKSVPNQHFEMKDQRRSTSQRNNPYKKREGNLCVLAIFYYLIFNLKISRNY